MQTVIARIVGAVIVSGCLEAPAPAALRVDLSRCTGTPADACGARLRAAVADGPNACLVVRGADGTVHARWWRWYGDGRRSALERSAALSLAGPLDVAVFLFAEPVDDPTCRALAPESACDAPCLVRLLEQATRGDAPIDFVDGSRCAMTAAPDDIAEQARCDAPAGECRHAPDDCLTELDGLTEPDGALDAAVEPVIDSEAERDAAREQGVDPLDAETDTLVDADQPVDQGGDRATDACVPGEDERCDDLDNDCDGRVDEGIWARVCWADGVDPDVLMPGRSVCTVGESICRAGRWTPCDGIAPGAEACHDGRDDDCDGEVDEGCYGGPCTDASSCPEAPLGSEAWCEDVPGGRCGLRGPRGGEEDDIGCGCTACERCIAAHGLDGCLIECDRCAIRSDRCGGYCARTGDESDDACSTLCDRDATCRPDWACGGPAVVFQIVRDGEGRMRELVAADDGFQVCRPAAE